MSIIATADDFEGTGVEPFYTKYQDYPFFQQRADYIATTYPTSNPLCIAGAGYGYLMRKLIDKGKTVAGIDASNYAHGKSTVLTQSERARYIIDDATRDTAYRQATGSAGLGPNGRFPLIVTEDLLPCASSDAEAVLFIQAARARVVANGGNILHIVTASKTGDVLGNLSNPPASVPPGCTLRTARLLWHTLEAWKQLAGSPAAGITERWLDTETWRVL
jgi:hypothetical protein